MKEKLIAYGVLIALGAGALWYAKGRIGALVPGVVRDGFEAGGVMVDNLAHSVLNPLDAFGIEPAGAAWEKTVPWAAPVPSFNDRRFSGEVDFPMQSDPVSNNNLGMNFNYF